MKGLLHNRIAEGLLFTILWASASVAGKFGLTSAEPMVLFTIRFLLAGVILLVYVHGIERQRLPVGKEWRHVTIFGLFNTALYLGFFIVALQYVAAGITSLAIALNPLFIGLMSAVWTRRRISWMEWGSILLGVVGVGIASYPLLQSAHATVGGLMLLALSMITYSFGSVYYATITWQLPRISINAWQVFISGLMISPLIFVMHKNENHFDATFWFSQAWLVIMVSIFAVQLWLRLLKTDAVRASLWLYLCPIFGFLFSWLLLNEPVSYYTFLGAMLVIVALYMGQHQKKFST